MFVYFFYVVGVGRAKKKQTCDAMTFLLHYFTICSVSWMTVNAVQMYIAFTQVQVQIQVCLLIPLNELKQMTQSTHRDITKRRSA